MHNNNPVISVVMPVYNCEEYIYLSIKSILEQSYSNFELIVINDGSTDGTLKILENFSDNRIRIFSQNNMGISKSLNKGIRISQGKFIARHDADDISENKRLEKQLQYMRLNPNIALLGTWSKIIINNKFSRKNLIHPRTDEDCKIGLLFDNCFSHGSILIKKSTLIKVGFYNENIIGAEDYELWSRIAKKFKVANIPEFLHYYRVHKSSVSYDRPLLARENAFKISMNNILELSNPYHDVETAQYISNIFHDISISSNLDFKYFSIFKLLFKCYKNIFKKKELLKIILKVTYISLKIIFKEEIIKKRKFKNTYKN